MARPEGLKSESRRAERGGVLGDRMLPYPSTRMSGERCKLPQWGPGQNPGDLVI